MRTIESIHRDHTRRSEPDGARVPIPADDCPACEYQRRICRSKTKFGDYEIAHTHAREKNILTGWGLMLVPYECCWCGDWHVTRARRNHYGKARWNKVEKERRRWLTEREVARREREG
jgi:hypothetical protein